MDVNSFVVAEGAIPVRGFDDIAPRSVGRVVRINGDYDVYFIGRDKTVHCKPGQVREFDPYQTGKPKDGGTPYKVKICNMCHLLKNQDEFQPNQKDGYGRTTTRPSCNECRAEIVGEPMPLIEKKTMNDRKPKPLDIFTCPLCQKRTIVDVTVKICMDHSARTGKGRDWICDSCNTGLGRFRDEIPVLERLVAYLRRFG